MSESKKVMLIITAPCPKCAKDMLLATVGGDTGFDYGAEKFSEEEQQLARLYGVKIGKVFSQTRQESYVANICKECSAFIGKFFLFAHFYAPAMRGEYEVREISIE